MATPLNRPAIFLTLAAFVLVSVFCISTEAPIMQHDILLRCQETLLLHRIPIRGLSVTGRDVILSGAPQSAITSTGARRALEAVQGVRIVTIRVSNDMLAPPRVSLKQNVQEKIDRLLRTQGIAFKAGTTVLMPDSESALDKIAAYLSEASSLHCDIQGYDNQPSEMRQDWVLALQRALATEDYLETKGISDERLSAHSVSTGESRGMDSTVDLIVRIKE